MQNLLFLVVVGIVVLAALVRLVEVRAPSDVVAAGWRPHEREGLDGLLVAMRDSAE